MKSAVLFTQDRLELEQGVDHLLNNGLWIRILTLKAKKSALIYSLDRALLVEFADIFGLTKFRDGHTVQAGTKITHPFCIEVWGKKLESIVSWKCELSGNDQSTAGIPQS